MLVGKFRKAMGSFLSNDAKMSSVRYKNFHMTLNQITTNLQNRQFRLKRTHAKKYYEKIVRKDDHTENTSEWGQIVIISKLKDWKICIEKKVVGRI